MPRLTALAVRMHSDYPERVKTLSWVTTLGQRRTKAYTLLLGDVSITVTPKRIKRIYVRVHPPDGRVTISAPTRASRSVVRAFAESQLEWIHRQRDRVQRQPREALAEFATGEIHYMCGKPLLLTVVERNGRQHIVPDDGTLTMFVRPGATLTTRADVLAAWHKRLLRESLPPMIQKWERCLNVRLEGYHLRRMKSRWGTCNCRTKHIRLNTELATKPEHLLDYVVLHEMIHLIVPNHGKRFVALMNKHYPAWREARAELNRTLPPRL